jgi:hypothetical protein
MSAPEPKYVAETLAWCNAQRKFYRKRPLKRLPKGEIGNPEKCPCGAATGLGVRAVDYITPERLRLPLPRAVRRFVAAFDNERLPQYVRRSKS